ncbi:hypothetical protein FACS189456_5580 [Bacteroidia bacterium]|nr:hypothetical protein FACS189456_5580 [Bacteroidia bacterium]
MSFKILYYVQLLLVKGVKIVTAVLLTALLAFFVIMWNLRTQPINVTPYMLNVQKETHVKPQQRWVPLDSISPDVIKSVIVCEDNNFFFHFGFDVDAIKEAMQHNQQGKKVYGASTITQQMVKNVFLSHQRTWVRKVAELGLSVLVELMWGKARIMEVYLNVIEMGENVYGIEAAAKHHFHKRAFELTKYESMMIALSLPNPKKFNPARPSRYMQARQEKMFETMDKLMKYGWYKNIKNIKQIKVNYLEAYPNPPRSIAKEEEPVVENEQDTTEIESEGEEAEEDNIDTIIVNNE